VSLTPLRDRNRTIYRACQAHSDARSLMDAEFLRLGIVPWDCHGETVFAELMAELDRLAE
jgi:hypothetical protein